MTTNAAPPYSPVPSGPPAIHVRGVSKAFHLHLRDGLRIQALSHVTLDVCPGECVVLQGPSGAGKSSLLRLLYGNYRMQSGHASVRANGCNVDLTAATPRELIAMRRTVMGYASQFLRVIPRVGALDVVSEPALRAGQNPEEAAFRARHLLERLRIPPSLWNVPPATFSGGEQQRINLARVFVYDYPVLLLDEPTASLDEANSLEVVALMEEARANGAAVLAVFHDRALAARVATRFVDLHDAAAPLRPGESTVGVPASACLKS